MVGREEREGRRGGRGYNKNGEEGVRRSGVSEKRGGDNVARETNSTMLMKRGEASE